MALDDGWAGHRVEALPGSPDDLRLFSSMTMFDQALACFFDGQRDPRALAMLD